VQESGPSSAELPPSPELRLVFWETTAGCNLQCLHCRRLDVATGLTQSDLSTEQARRMIGEAAELASPIFVFSGGEPLIRPDIFDLARFAADLGLKTALASNGTLIDRQAAESIRTAGFGRVSISVDGADAETHDALRRQAGAFARALAGLRHVREASVATQINCALARHNAGQLEALVALAESLGVDALHCFLLVPVGCGQQIAEEQMLSASEVETLLMRLAELAGQTSLQIKATCAPHYYRIVRQLPGRRAGHRPSAPAEPMHVMTRGCLAGSAVCFISHEGQVYPCGYLPVVAGDVTEQRFCDIWRGSEVFRRLRDPSLLGGRCGVCEFAAVCGGCRARAFYQYGDYLAEEPCCNYIPTRTGRSAGTAKRPAAGD
jgi:radical SAM protein with 4Fe4S-binding SPASM domain